MPIILMIGLIGFFLGAWFLRRKSTLTRSCRWREDRRSGRGHFRCAFCGVECKLLPGKEPRQCLRPAQKSENAEGGDQQ